MTVSATISRLLDRATVAIEKADVLDPTSEAIDSVVAKVGPGPVKDLLSGVAFGHPVHPALVTVPIGALTGVVALDLAGDQPAAARRLVGLSLIGSVPAVLAGLSDWSDTRGAERRVGLVHLGLNVAGLGLVAASWFARRPRAAARPTTGPWLSFTGFGILGLSSWLGGHLSYALGVGVDTTAFQKPPVDWTDAAADSDVVEGRPIAVTVEDMPVLLLRQGGHIVAIGDRCTHRGGPLHEGTVEDGCIECPWHGSKFDLTDGSVVLGPATRPAPVLSARVRDGRVQVRRDEERTLRLNPTS